MRMLNNIYYNVEYEFYFGEKPCSEYLNTYLYTRDESNGSELVSSEVMYPEKACELTWSNRTVSLY